MTRVVFAVFECTGAFEHNACIRCRMKPLYACYSSINAVAQKLSPGQRHQRIKYPKARVQPAYLDVKFGSDLGVAVSAFKYAHHCIPANISELTTSATSIASCAFLRFFPFL